MLKRDALEASPLADLHELASEIGLEGYRRLRKADLIDRLLDASGGEAAATEADTSSDDAAQDDKPKKSRSRGGRGRRRGGDDEDAKADKADAGPDDRDRDRDRGDRDEQRSIEGTIEVLANGSGFVRPKHPEESDDDVYVSAAQVRRCELISGDKVGGPFRSPRRSEKHPSLVRVETINGRPADEVAGDATPYDEQACIHPDERFELGGDDVTLKAIEWLAPIGRGSRVVLHGPAHAGKTETLRLLASALSSVDKLDVQLVLAGARPEEAAMWAEAGVEPVETATLGAPHDAQVQAVERALDSARRIAQRGGDAVVLVDGLHDVPPHQARRLLANARNLKDAGSLTIIATALVPFGGETTVIALAPTSGPARFDLTRSSTLKAEKLVGEEGAKAIAEARSKATL